MRCPHCYYEDFLSGRTEPEYEGEKGDFYVGTLMRQHPRLSRQTQTVKLFGCPSCMKTFISEESY